MFLLHLFDVAIARISDLTGETSSRPIVVDSAWSILHQINEPLTDTVCIVVLLEHLPTIHVDPSCFLRGKIDRVIDQSGQLLWRDINRELEMGLSGFEHRKIILLGHTFSNRE